MNVKPKKIKVNTFNLMNKPLLFLSLGLLIFGLFMILSASSMESYVRYNKSPYEYFLRQGLFIAASLIASLIVIKIPTKTYSRLEKVILVTPFILLAAVFLFGVSVHNAKSWINIGPIRLQPSEFIKIIYIIYLAVYYERNKDNLDNKWTILFPIIMAMITFFIIVMQPDLGTASILAILVGVLFYAVPMSKTFKQYVSKILIGGIVLVSVLMLVTNGSILKRYQRDRLNFFNPCERYQEQSGYQLCNSFIALKNGGLTGQGIGKSTQKYLYLPEGYTDFIFPIIVEEWGLFVGIAIIIIYFIILYQMYKIATSATNFRNNMIAYGVLVYTALHIFINLGGVLGLLPLTGVPLPFLSYGGSFCLSLMIGLSLIQRVNIETGLEKLKNKKN